MNAPRWGIALAVAMACCTTAVHAQGVLERVKGGGKITIAQSLRTIWPFWLAGVVVLLLVAFVPELSMWLPKALKA